MTTLYGARKWIQARTSFTADHKPLLGEDPIVRGFFHGCGFNSGGMMLSTYPLTFT